MKILVLGADGQLARHLKQLLPDAEYWGRNVFDLRQPLELSSAIRRLEPSFVVNAAAYTAVDKAESECDDAWSVNAEAPAMAARAAAALDIPLLHVSTDYVFDGTKIGEYSVGDPCKPINVYGASKLAGELAVRTLSARTWVLRTSWVFSEHGSNFPRTIIRLASRQSELRVVADQFGRPTYAGDLAQLIAQMVRGTRAQTLLPYGTYHAVGGPVTSWYAFAQAITRTAVRWRLLSADPAISAISTSEYPTAARRPQNSALAPSTELQDLFTVDFDWLRGLDKAVEQMALGAG